MKRKIKEWLSMQVVKNPQRMVLATILLFNIAFLIISALIISSFSLNGTSGMDFFQAAFCTITMILDAGCIQFVVEDIGTSGVAISVVCLIIIVVGMITFTGAVIGYISNYISSFIDNSNAGAQKLHMSGHMVILNWNTRASEIINDLLYCKSNQKIVVLVSSRKSDVEKEINERILDTVAKENHELREKLKGYFFLKRKYLYSKHKYKNNLTVVVREGDIFSSKQLRDISVEKAISVIILGDDLNNSVCKFETKAKIEEMGRGNSQTVKTLMQVADITGADYSEDNQKIVVEITDEWTYDLVKKIIKRKEVEGKCNIVPVRVNQVLGQFLSQFSLMPELNLAYRELFSNRGATFYSKRMECTDEIEYVKSYIKTHKNAIPLTFMESRGKSYCYYSADDEKDIDKISTETPSGYSVKLNKHYWIEEKNIIILGHNSRCTELMDGYKSFVAEWGYRNSDKQILKIIVIDDDANLKKMNYYKDYPFVIETISAEIFDKEIICESIDKLVSQNNEDISFLILSDDSAVNENIDANALANLVYVQDIINQKIQQNPDFDAESIDVVVEIIDPKHHDIVNSYNINNVVISNRYISKMINQIGEKEALFDFYTDILTYDDDDSDGYDSMEIYLKKVSDFFEEVPPKCNADEFVKAVYEASISSDVYYPTIVLGYVKPGGRVVLFSKNRSQIEVELESHDKIIVFTNH